MPSTCSLSNNQNDCQTVQPLNMTLQQELPVFDGNNNLTYRSIACARCNKGGNLSFWGLEVTCLNSLRPPQQDIAAVKKFVEEKDECSWKYTPFPNLKHRHRSCVVHDSQCASDKLPGMAVIKQLCYSYSMLFTVKGDALTYYYRNPHCALCNPEGRHKISNGENGKPPPPLSILFDVSSNIIPEKEPQTTQPPIQGFNLTSHVLNCSSAKSNCTVTYGSKSCMFLSSLMNQSTQIDLNNINVNVFTPQQIPPNEDAMEPKGNTVFILCPENEKYKQHEFSETLSCITMRRNTSVDCLAVFSACRLPVLQRTSQSAWKMSH